MLEDHKYQQKYLRILMRYQSTQNTKSSDSDFEAITDIFQWEEKSLWLK